MLAEQVRDVVNRLVRDDFRSIFRIEDWDWNSPGTLTADDPVSTVTDHVVKTCHSPFRDPIHFLDFTEHVFTEIFDRCEPLWCRTEDDRLLRTPVMRVRVFDELQVEQVAILFKFHTDLFVRIFVEETFETRGFVCHVATVIHRAKDV